MARLFISYNNADGKLATDVAAALQSLGHEIAMDTTSLVPGVDWRAKLDAELKRSDGLVVLLTKNSVASSFVSAEVGSARTIARETGRMLIVPVIADDIAVPPLVNDLFAVVAPDRDIAKIAAAINRAITSFEEDGRARRRAFDDPATSRDRTIGLVLAAAVFLAFIAFLFVPPDRLNPATMPIVRFLAAIAAALAAYLFVGSMSIGGQLPFFRRVEVKAVSSFAVFLLVLLLFFKGIPTGKEGGEGTDTAQTTSATIAPPLQTIASTSEIGTSSSTTDSLPSPHPKLELIEKGIGAIEEYVSKVQAVERSPNFYGPRDDTRLNAEIAAWERRKNEIIRGRDACKKKKDRAEANGCFDAVLQQNQEPEPLPPPGMVVPVGRRQGERTEVINFYQSEPYHLLAEQSAYTKPLTVLVKGKWAGHFTGTENRCLDIIVYTLHFKSGSRSFTLDDKDGGRDAATRQTGAVFLKPRGSAYVMENWPPGRPLSVTYYDPRGYTNQAICPDDPAYVLVWQNDPRINADDPYEALKEIAKR